MWIARNKDNSLYLFISKPSLSAEYPGGEPTIFLVSEPTVQYISECSHCSDDILEISKDLYPEVTFENSPKELLAK